MKRYWGVFLVAAIIALACGRGGEVKAAPAGPARDVAAPVPAAEGGATFADAARIESWLKSAGIPYKDRYDLYPSQFPDGCGWLAVYGTEKPEVILETYLFGSVELAEDFVTNRHADYSVRDVAQEYMIINNGPAVLVARYDLTGEDDGKMGVMSAFANAFAAGK